MNELTRTRVGAIDRSLQILDLLSERQEPMTTYGLARSTGAPVSTIYKLVDDLLERSMLSRVGENGIWLGPRLMRYGLTYRAKMDVFAEARREMIRLSEHIGETVQICARDEGMMTVIGMARAGDHFSVASDVGTRVPLNWTASGRLLLGHLDEAERLSIFTKSAKPSETGGAETDPAILSRLSREEFEARLAVQMSGSEFSVACIASPICDMDGKCLATISIVLPETRAGTATQYLTHEIQNAAKNIEKALGRRG